MEYHLIWCRDVLLDENLRAKLSFPQLHIEGDASFRVSHTIKYMMHVCGVSIFVSMFISMSVSVSMLSFFYSFLIFCIF